ncbi:unnamed protein product [Musa acuminata var. zebrina]
MEVGDPMLILFIALSHQYMKHLQVRRWPALERVFSLFLILIVCAYAHLLSSSDANRHRPEITRLSCCTDRAELISSAPWYYNLRLFLPL